MSMGDHHSRRTPTPDEERFWSKVYTTDDCWLWVGGRSGGGYGSFWDGTRNVPAHRWAYENFVEAVPGDLQIDHVCRVRHCVNPDHLEPVTPAENARRGIAGALASIRARAITHCPQGHEYTPENTGWHRKNNGRPPSRRCLTCLREKRLARRQAQRARGERVT